MLSSLFPLTRSLFVFDLETTSIDPKEARIVEIAFQQWTGLGLVKEWHSRINPLITITKESSAIHGITNADVTDRPTFKQIASNLATGFKDCDFCGQNIRYDLRVLQAEMQRAEQIWDYTNARIIDSYRLESIMYPRNLSALHEKYKGVSHEGAHGALEDVRATAAVIISQLGLGKLPLDLDKLHNMQWPGWIDSEGKFVFVDSVPCFGRWGKYANKPMMKADIGYWDFIVRGDFSPDVKKLASEAKMGRFPQQRTQETL